MTKPVSIRNVSMCAVFALLAASCSGSQLDAPEEQSEDSNQALFSTVPYRGVNLAGAEFGESNIPGTYGTHYVYPDPAAVTYYTNKGMNTVRLPFLWERVQRTL